MRTVIDPQAARGLLAFRAVPIGAIAVALACVAAPPSEHVGAETCGTCHEEAFAAWSTGPHARSLSGLTELQAADPACRTCHTMAPRRTEAELSGVQCESCHGPGGKYAPDHVMRDPVLARLLGLEDIDASTCATCHRPSTPSARPFDFAAAVQRVCVNRLLEVDSPTRTAQP